MDRVPKCTQYLVHSGGFNILNRHWQSSAEEGKLPKGNQEEAAARGRYVADSLRRVDSASGVRIQGGIPWTPSKHLHGTDALVAFQVVSLFIRLVLLAVHKRKSPELAFPL
jgi:hypothetical protein